MAHLMQRVMQSSGAGAPAFMAMPQAQQYLAMVQMMNTAQQATLEQANKKAGNNNSSLSLNIPSVAASANQTDELKRETDGGADD